MVFSRLLLGGMVWSGLMLGWPLQAQDVATQANAGPTVPAPVSIDLTGHWSGHWCSYANGHHGPVSAHFCRLDDQHYQVHFRGKFFRFLPFDYTVVLTVTGQEGDRVLLSGSHHLGLLWGTFSYQAWANETQFVAGYGSHKDRGQFVLNRCR